MSAFSKIPLALLFLAAPALAQSDVELTIETHRMSLMMEQADAALHILSPAWPISQPADDGDGDAYAQLLYATNRFNRTIAQACRAKLADPKFCAAPYDPPWLKTKPADLHAAVEDASTHITPFWTDVCARAKPKTADASLCVME
ncbi:MAG TPA: hypothetical protein VGG48_04640 [Rhizomicrobium sp.]